MRRKNTFASSPRRNDGLYKGSLTRSDKSDYLGQKLEEDRSIEETYRKASGYCELFDEARDAFLTIKAYFAYLSSLTRTFPYAVQDNERYKIINVI